MPRRSQETRCLRGLRSVNKIRMARQQTFVCQEVLRQVVGRATAWPACCSLPSTCCYIYTASLFSMWVLACVDVVWFNVQRSRLSWHCGRRPLLLLARRSRRWNGRTRLLLQKRNK